MRITTKWLVCLPVKVSPNEPAAGHPRRLVGYHQDPFDRLLVAQALTEPMCLMTHDANVAAYSDTILKI